MVVNYLFQRYLHRWSVPHFYHITRQQHCLFAPVCASFIYLLFFFKSSSSSFSAPLFPVDGTSPAIREEVKMENGRSPVLGSSLSESEGSELMEGAAAAVGRQQSLSIVVSSSRILHLAASDCFAFCFFSPQVLWSFRCPVMVHVHRTTHRNPSRLRPRRSPLCIRLKVLNRHSLDLQCYTNNLLRYHPNPSPDYLITLQVHSLLCTFSYISDSVRAFLILPYPHFCCRRWPNEVAVYVGEVISSSTSKEAYDICTCWEHGALFARLPEVPRPCQPCSNGRAPPAVRDTTCPPPPAQPNHRGTQQDPGPHHAEVWEVRALTVLWCNNTDKKYGLCLDPTIYLCMSSELWKKPSLDRSCFKSWWSPALT